MILNKIFTLNNKFYCKNIIVATGTTYANLKVANERKFIGKLNELHTNEKETIVAAINDLYYLKQDVADPDIECEEKSVVGAINLSVKSMNKTIKNMIVVTSEEYNALITPDEDGVKLVARQFADALKRLGLEEIDAVGTRFDPEFHEAVSHIEDPEKGEQEIVQEYRKGYRIGNKVVRHSMVIVAN